MRSIPAYCAAALVAVTLGVAGCAGTYRGTYTATYATSTPQMVAIGPDLWVIENYPSPVFYSDGYYWRYYSGTWYRSYRGHNDWVTVRYDYVPVHLRSIDRPQRYVRYHAPRGYVRRVPPGWNRDRGRGNYYYR